MVKSPTLIPKRILSMMDQAFLSDAVLRGASDAPSGSVLYRESTPLFAEDDPAIMDEFGEIPTTNGSLGEPKVARVVRRALGLRVSKTMIDRNATDEVNTQVMQIKNTMLRAWEDAFFSAVVDNAQVQSITTDTAWSASTDTHIRGDVEAAKYLVKQASADDDDNQKYGYEADTLILSTETETDFLQSDEVTNPYVGNMASENLKFTGKLPNKFHGLDVLVSWRMSAYLDDGAMVCQRKTLGGISDERTLQATPLYGEGGGPNGGPTESYRTDLTRASAIFIDQPKCVVLIDGVNGSTTYPRNVTVN
ncbi:MAG: hypothetical protein ACRDQA_22875 [Nocardioidaceae bacterium]